VNVEAVRDALDRAYAPALRAAGVGGETLLWFFIDETGLPRYVRLDRTSGHDELDRAAVAVGRVMRFTPALNRDQAVPVWVKLPVVFDPGSSGAGGPIPEGSGASAAGEAPGDVIAELRREARETGREREPAVAAGGAVQEGPRFTPFTVRPELLDVEAVSEALEAAYPPLLREAGIGGSPVVWFFIDAGGVVRETRINRSSGHPALDEAALKVASVMGFTPARNGDDPVEVWVSLPITFGPR
jgi:TonB family protein